LEVPPEIKMEEAVEEVHHTERSSTAIYWFFTTRWTWQNHLKSPIIVNKSILGRSIWNLCNYGEFCSDYRHVSRNASLWI